MGARLTRITGGNPNDGGIPAMTLGSGGYFRRGSISEGDSDGSIIPTPASGRISDAAMTVNNSWAMKSLFRWRLVISQPPMREPFTDMAVRAGFEPAVPFWGTTL
jgi:hypothetical protein